jgi:hypothetical protein
VSTEQRRVVKVFLASPSDLAPERLIAKEIVDKLNKQWAEFFSLQVELVGWEDSTSAYGRPQDIINQDLVQCEFFIGMLWHEWGKPNGRYNSGFEEEYRLSEKSLKQTGRPEISLLFKNMDQSRLRDQGPGLTQVLRFKEEIKDKVIYKGFENEGEFRERFEFVVTDYIQKLKRSEQRESAQVAPARGEGVQADDVLEKVEGQPQIPRDALTFVKLFTSKAGNNSSVAPISASEVARFRLLGTLVSERGNDENVLGVHDANVLFVSLDSSSLTNEECAALVDAGLTHFDSENVPYWKWLVAVQGLDSDFLEIRSLYGTTARRAGALKAMRLLQLKLSGVSGFKRGDYLDSWFLSSTPYQVREAALEYLAGLGIPEDLKNIKEEIDRADSQTVKAARNAYVSIMLTQSAAMGLDALFELQADSFDEALVDQVFGKPTVLPAASLERCLTHKNAQLRARAAEVMRERHTLSEEAATRLSDDSDPEVRLQGLLGRLATGETISEDVAKGVLVRRKTSNAGLGYLGFGQSSTEGEPQFERFRVIRRERLTIADLRRESSINTIFGQEFRFEEIRRAFRSRGNELRNAIRDQFRSWFSDALAEAEKIISNPETIQKIKDLEDSLRKQWVREALNIVLWRGESEDLPLLREAIDREVVEVNEYDVDFLRNRGEWQDIKTVLMFGKRDTGPFLGSLFGSIPSEAEVARLSIALLAVAKDRLGDLIVMIMNDRTKAAVVSNAKAAAFRELTNAEILELLKSGSEAVRRATALRCVIAFSKARLSELMSRYLSLSTMRYYNVTLWLDLGISVERTRAGSIAKTRAELN